MKAYYFLAASALSVASSAYAAPVIDQSFDPRPNATAAQPTNGSGFRRAQTFTAGLTGTLTSLGVLGGSNNSTLNLLLVVNGSPTTTVVGTGAFQSITDGFTTFTTNLAQITGQSYAFELVDTTGFDVFGSLTGGYAGGADFFVNPLSSTRSFEQTPYDTGFRTFVEAASDAVPEPATWAMMIAGFGVVGGAMRRRSQVRTAVSFA